MLWLHVEKNYCEIVLVLYVTSETEKKLFQPLKKFWN